MSRRFPRAVRGGVGFLTRLPVSFDERDWEALQRTPAAFPVVGYLAGVLVALPLLAAARVPDPTVGFAYVLAVYLVTGIHHVDGVADLGDAFVVHGDANRRREVLKDTTTGVGAVLAVGLVLVGLGLAGLGLAALPVATAVGVVIAAEVGSRVGMAAMACFGRASHEGMGSRFTEAATPAAFVAPAALAVPAAVLTWPHGAAAVALVAGLAGAGLPWLWATRNLGGINGDVFGAATEVGRVVGVHAGVIVWTLS
ncbi:adenosylcobinamide-GDP ribazoletransferase [Natrarchaeobaculum aegyptiacum]|uniref:Adenosylcobinamide-GDP ribazoletransferase n=1 Tax=Natrarchaeobaculum aegyptiacum TaxID=745377 RepID=A0A2Z2HQD0_9EURY|nr:adenosylcobinamide-GDP ribazoletransferase [Natrarchaeobaculum aegyptiacum]ARS88853.1 adenosylcobinamide-GDP ribazoletransferase [Natrarchaeobaculum aegyptiacum]